ncbi:hypothetical protein MNBD_IGNAVI01-800 [hydrothermal vent metagenome]|uniref:DUF3108 domain-containing protein n=1 Tax=hydrothermal vent metagenome TaxID=652676 RepID=A0A3B1BUE3_9ZZZZ
MERLKILLKHFLFIPAIVIAQGNDIDSTSSFDTTKSNNAHIEQKTYNLFNYQPAEDIRLIYDSDFGETTSKIVHTEDGYLVFNENNDFHYIQSLKYEDDGIYLLKADQEVDLFLFLSKEIETLYPTPALQMPKFLTVGQEWNWEGYKVEDDDSIKVKTIGKVIGEESVTVPAGTFDALKIRYKIETSEGEHSVIDQWIVKGIGRVKLHVDMDGNGFIGTILSILGYDEIEFTLKEIKYAELVDKY